MTRPAPSAASLPVAAALIGAVLAGCGDPNAPHLTRLRCRDADGGCQSIENPFRLQLAIDFEDEDGDLGAGTATVTVDGVDQTPAPMVELMERSGVPADAIKGTLLFDVELLPVKLEDGMIFEVGLRVEDAKKRPSNEPRVSLRVKL